jgi:hypothetical protein
MTIIIFSLIEEKQAILQAFPAQPEHPTAKGLPGRRPSPCLPPDLNPGHFGASNPGPQFPGPGGLAGEEQPPGAYRFGNGVSPGWSTISRLTTLPFSTVIMRYFP